jgi:hypothetical protein
MYFNEEEFPEKSPRCVTSPTWRNCSPLKLEFKKQTGTVFSQYAATTARQSFSADLLSSRKCFIGSFGQVLEYLKTLGAS